MSDAELNAALRRRCIHLEADRVLTTVGCSCSRSVQPVYRCGHFGDACTVLSKTGAMRYCSKKCEGFEAIADDARHFPPDATTAGKVAGKLTRRFPPVDVIITCHNYGRFLTDAIESALAQEGVSVSIVVVDDASTDNTPVIAQRYAASGVDYIRIEARNCSTARRIGFERGRSRFVMFLDADNKLSPNYLSEAVKLMQADSRVGIVACDLQIFGAESRLQKLTGEFDEPAFRRANCLDAGCVARREALAQSRALADESTSVAEDWVMWRRVLDSGNWRVASNPIPLLYRKHDANKLFGRQRDLFTRERAHFEDAGLANQTVTIFTTFSKRVLKQPALWQRRLEWLQSQTWPRHQTRLLIANTTHQRLTVDRLELESLRLAGVGWYDHPVGRPGLEDIDRRQTIVEADVQTVVAAIYNRMLREVSTDFVLTLEDDVFPERRDVIDALLACFDANTYAVSGAYRQRYQATWSSYDRDAILAPNHLHRQRGAGVVEIGGTGFGCLLLSTAQLRDIVFVGNEPESKYYDCHFFHEMRRRRPELRCRLNWDVACEHVGETFT